MFMKPFKHNITNVIYWAPKNHMRFITSQSNAYHTLHDMTQHDMFMMQLNDETCMAS